MSLSFGNTARYDRFEWTIIYEYTFLRLKTVAYGESAVSNFSNISAILRNPSATLVSRDECMCKPFLMAPLCFPFQSSNVSSISGYNAVKRPWISLSRGHFPYRPRTSDSAIIMTWWATDIGYCKYSWGTNGWNGLENPLVSLSKGVFHNIFVHIKMFPEKFLGESQGFVSKLRIVW